MSTTMGYVVGNTHLVDVILGAVGHIAAAVARLHSWSPA